MEKNIPYFEDTIVARATPSGESAIAIIRISGSNTLNIISKIFISNDSSINCQKFPHKKQILGTIFSSEENNEKIDSCTIVFSKTPHSYTGEDTAEIYSHGNMLIVARIIDLCLKYGARIAEPGEFTKRAFLNGKMDLAQAEAVCEIIRSKTNTAQKFALKNLNGSLSKSIESIRKKIIESAAEIEARLDFPEDNIEEISDKRILENLEESKSFIYKLIQASFAGKIFSEGANVAIVGKPNTGKSSLFNALVKKERAIVTPHPGTTRDIIEVVLDIEGIPVKFIDTAGIRTDPEEIESIGIQKTFDEIQNADLILFLIDAAAKIDKNDLIIYNRINNNNFLIVLNKIDLIDCDEKIFLKDLGVEKNKINYIKVSALQKTGIDILEKLIAKTLLSKSETFDTFNFSDESIVIANLRHIENLRKSHKSIENAITGIVNKNHLELIAIDLRDSLEALDKILGIKSDEEILNYIFNNFCIGK